jgi:arylsulfatase A-like enzyme
LPVLGRIRRAAFAALLPALAVVGALAGGVGCGLFGPERTPNLLLISIDTLRPDHLGCYGYARPTSPALDALAARGVLFEDVSAPSPWTLPSHASLLTGLYPRRHGLESHAFQLPAAVHTLAEILAPRGFTTAAIVNSHNLSEKFGLQRGFGHFVYVQENVGDVEPSRVEKEALAWLGRGPKAPFFLFLHFYDVHSDYRSRSEYERRFARPYGGRVDGTTDQLMEQRAGRLELGPGDAEQLRDLYDAGIRQMDDGIARVLEALRVTGQLEGTVVVVTSDHGEEFLEHGGVLHGRTQYEEVIRVPLILTGPGLPAGVRIPEPVSLVDVKPTLLGLLGEPAPPGLDGIDVAPAWKDPARRAPERFVFAEADHHNDAVEGSKRAVRRGRFKLHYDMISGEARLFDLEKDPQELSPMPPEAAPEGAALMQELRESMLVKRERRKRPPLSPEEVERLRSLGYLQ